MLVVQDRGNDQDVHRHRQHHKGKDAPKAGAIDPCGLYQFLRKSGIEITEQQRHDGQAEHDMHGDDARQ